MATEIFELGGDPPATTACRHCGTPSGRGDFCCSGCQTVFELLHAQNLQEYYRHRDAAAGPAKVSAKSYAELDDPGYLQKNAVAQGNTLCTELYLEGVHCAACVWLVERAHKVVPGVIEARLDLGRSLAKVRFDPSVVKLSQIARTFDRFGYPAHPAQDQDRRGRRLAEDRALWIKIGVAGACAGNAMLLAFALYGGLFAGMEPEYLRLFRWASLLVALPSLLYAGSVFWRGAAAAIRTRTPHMDLPITIGVAIGFVHSTLNTVRGAGEIYFDSLTTLLFVLLIGRWLTRRHQRAAADAAELLYALAPSSARRIEGDAVVELPIESVAAGDLLEVRAGERVPADGTIESGRSTLDASLLTGEARPIAVEPGRTIHAGTINLGAPLRIRAAETGHQTRVGRLMKLVEEAAQRRAPVVKLADRLSGTFTWVVLALAAATFAGWWWVSPDRAVENAVALLIVTCPCALAMATPLAVSAAVGRAARAGILIKGGDVIEKLASVATMIFDKTGTLTEGRQRLLEWRGDPALQPLVAALEAQSAHPIAQALVAALPASGAVVEAAEHVLGAGIAGRVEGQEVVVGSPRFVASRGVEVPAWARASEAEWTAQGATAIFAARDGQLAAAASIGDAVRADAASSLGALAQRGWRLGILSGDDPRTVAAIAARVGIAAADTRGGATPEDKLAQIDLRVAGGPVVMIGDGVNDAAALSSATVGIAVHGGAEASLAAADVFLTRPGVAPVVELVDGSRRTMAVIRRNLIFSLLYNAAGVALAASGLLGPLGAAILMPLSSLTVVTSSYRARTFGGDRCR